MSIAFHPGFKTNGLFYIYYNQENPASQNLKPQNYPFRSVISELKVSASDPDKADMSSERIILEVPQPFWNHKGGELCFGPDGYLYLGLGDGGLGGDPFGSGQSTSTLLATKCCALTWTRAASPLARARTSTNCNTAFQHACPDNPFAERAGQRKRRAQGDFRLRVCAIRGATVLTAARPAICGWATSARFCGRRLT